MYKNPYKLFSCFCMIVLLMTACSKDEPSKKESSSNEIIGTWYGAFKYSNPVSGTKYNYLTLTFNANATGSMEYESSVSYRNAQFTYTVSNNTIRCSGVCASTDDDDISDFNLTLKIEGNKLYPQNMYTNYILTKDNAFVTESN